MNVILPTVCRSRFNIHFSETFYFLESDYFSIKCTLYRGLKQFFGFEVITCKLNYIKMQ